MKLIIIVLIIFIVPMAVHSEELSKRMTSDISGIIKVVEVALTKANNSLIANQTALFIWNLYVELKKQGFTEKQAMTLISGAIISASEFK